MPQLKKNNVFTAQELSSMGSKHLPLTRGGILQAWQIGKWMLENGIMPQHEAFSSTYLRAEFTLKEAYIAYTVLSQSPLPFPCTVKPMSLLDEHNMGEFFGLSREERYSRFPKEAEAFYGNIFEVAPPGGESLKEVEVRVRTFLQQMAVYAEHVKSGHLLACGHENFAWVMQAVMLDVPIKAFHAERASNSSIPRLGNGEIFVLAYQPTKKICWNLVQHIKPKGLSKKNLLTIEEAYTKSNA